jgi:hypothetical protein
MTIDLTEQEAQALVDLLGDDASEDLIRVERLLNYKLTMLKETRYLKALTTALCALDEIQTDWDHSTAVAYKELVCAHDLTVATIKEHTERNAKCQ